MSEQKLTNREGRAIQEYLWEMQQTAEFTDLILACSDGTVHAVIKPLEEIIDCVIIPGVAAAEVEEALQ